jgi:hypothetical protein
MHLPRQSDSDSVAGRKAADRQVQGYFSATRSYPCETDAKKSSMEKFFRFSGMVAQVVSENADRSESGPIPSDISDR